MSYCEIDDVQAHIPTQIWDHDGSAPQPSVAEVTDFISDIDEEIDARLAARYKVPITGTKALKVVNSIASRLVAIRVWGIVFAGQTGEGTIPEDWRRAEKMLDEIARGRADLTDAEHLMPAQAGQPGSPSSTLAPLKRDDGDLDEKPPIFTMSDEF